MKSVKKNRKIQALKASKNANGRKVLGLNSAKQVDSEWYYNLSDMETVVAAVLAELDNDPGAGITLDSTEAGIVLNVVGSEGDEYTVDVELVSEEEGEVSEEETEVEEEAEGE